MFSTLALTLLSSVFGACGLLLVGVAVSTDYWLLMEEGVILQQNQSMEVRMALHSGMWRVCFVAGMPKNTHLVYMYRGMHKHIVYIYTHNALWQVLCEESNTDQQ